MASDPAHDAMNNLRRRKRPDVVAYQLPGSPTPKLHGAGVPVLKVHGAGIPAPKIHDAGSRAPNFRICDRYGDSPLEPVLIPLARALILLDVELLRSIQIFHQKFTSSADEIRKSKVLPFLKKSNEVTLRWRDINSGQCQFSQLYLKSNQFVHIWAEGLRIIAKTLESSQISKYQSQMRTDFENILYNCENLANKLQSQMVDAARQGLLESEVLFAIQERWIRLDETLDLHYRLCNPGSRELELRMLRNSPAWAEVRRLIQIDDTRARNGKELTQFQSASSVRNKAEPGTMIGPSEGKKVDALIFWLAFFGCAIISTALFALGYGRSLHLRGTVNDPDFWFLIQAVSTQILGLAVSALVERKRDSLAKWRWRLPTAIAGACALGAIPLYLFVPKEWSSFLSAVAGATQTFMTLQYLLF